MRRFMLGKQQPIPFSSLWPLFSVAVALLALVSGFSPDNAYAGVTCSSSAAAQNSYTVTPSHGTSFYIDSGVAPALNAGYIGYRVTNGTGSTKNGLWAQVGTFSGGVLNLANAADSIQQLPSLSNGSTGVAYFMLKANGATTTAQKHTFTLYDRRPDLFGANALYTCDFTFSKVKETIKASSNKLALLTASAASAPITASTSTPTLGQTITISVEGETGQIGAGSAPDNDLIWLTPAAVSSWPTRQLRLEGVSILFDGNKNLNTANDQVTYSDRLVISPADGVQHVDNSGYRATYTFRVIGIPTSTVKAVPVAQISSGTQYKHTDTSASGATVNLSFSSVSVNATLTKSITSTSSLPIVNCSGACAVPGKSFSGNVYVDVPYRLTASTTNATDIIIDEMVDTPSGNIVFKTGSATITDDGRSNVAISDPVYMASESALDPRPVHFVGPFTFKSGTNATLNYRMYVPVGTFSNTSYAKIGDVVIGATASAMSRITVTSDGSGTVDVVSDTVSFNIDAQTTPATNITTTGATLNGTVDPNGTSVLTGQFEYSTSSNLSGSTVVTATTPADGTLNGLTDPTLVSYSLSGLSSGTTYYYRVLAGSAQGAILSFTTTAVTAPPAVTTTVASAITTTTATLNGTINPNLTAITGIQFVYGTSSSLASGNTTKTVDDGSGTAALTANGSTTQAFSYDITGLTNGTTYYYKIRACTSALSGTYPNQTCSSFVDGAIVSFVAQTVPTAATSAATSITTSSATLNGTVNGRGNNTTVTFEISTVPDLSSGVTTYSAGTVSGSLDTAVNASSTGLSPSTEYYFRVVGNNGANTVYGEVLTFTTSALASRTLTIDSASYVSSYTLLANPPTITSTPSAGTGTKSYSSSTTGVCTVNSSSGLVTFVSVGTCTIGALITEDSTYATANATPVSFSVTLVPRTHSIDDGSYVASYKFTDPSPTITSTPSAGTGTKSYSSSTTGVCTVNSSSGLVTFVSVGTCTIGSQIASDGTYAVADANTISFSITLGTRTLVIDLLSYAATYDQADSPPTITSTPSAGTGTKSYSSSTQDVCTIDASSGAVTFVSAGTCVIGAHIATDGTYDDTDAIDVSFTITEGVPVPVTQVATAVTATTATLNGTINPHDVTAAGRFEYSTTDNLTSGVATVSLGSFTGSSDTPVSTDLTDLSPGTTYYFRIVANASGDVFGSILSFTTSLLTRTYAIDGDSHVSSYTLADTPPTITSTPSLGGGAKTYASSTPDVCIIEASTGLVTFVSVGICTIGAHIDSDGTHEAKDADTVSFDVALAPRVHGITGSYPGYTMVDAPPTITSTPSAGTGTKTYSSSTPSVCTVGALSGSVTFLSAGTCTIGSHIASDGTYDQADADTVSFDIALAERTYEIDANSYLSGYLMTDTPPTITSTPSAGSGTKTYSSTTPSVCTIDPASGVVTFISPGTCTIGAHIASGGLYEAADASTVSFVVALAPRTISIDGGSYDPSYSLDDVEPVLTSTPTDGGGTKSYASDTPSVCMVNASSGAVTFVAVGTCTIHVSIGSDGTYDTATSVNISFSIGNPPLIARTHSITGSYPGYVMTDTPPTITSAPSIGTGTKSYGSATPSVCTVYPSSGAVTFVAVGTCTIGSTIDSDGTYSAATATEISFIIALAPQTLTFDPESYGASYTLTAAAPTVTVEAPIGSGNVTYSSGTPSVCTVDPVTGKVTFVSVGTCTLGAHVESDGIYYAANASSISFIIGSAPVPNGHSVLINGGSACDVNSRVTLRLASLDASEVSISNTFGGVGATWSAFSGPYMTIPWTLIPGDGTRTVFARFRNISTYSTIVRDSIHVDGEHRCTTRGGGDSPEVNYASTASTSPVQPGNPSPASPPRAYGRGPYDVYLVNPDGTERHIGSSYVKVIVTSSGVSTIRFEDKGSDFDYNDVVIRVDASDPSFIALTVISVNADWSHDLHLSYIGPDGLKYDVLVWADVHEGVGNAVRIDTSTAAIASMETVKVCDVSCSEVSYDLYIINPDGTERHTGSNFVKVTDLGNGKRLYGFEDRGTDFDYDDVLVDVDQEDCADVGFSMRSMSADWHHRLALNVLRKGIKKFGTIIIDDTQAATGFMKSVDAKHAPEMCVGDAMAAPKGACAPAVQFSRNLKVGMEGDDIRALQDYLLCRGLLPSTVMPSGYFGSNTLAAVTAFQRANGIDPIGTVGPRTRTVLNALVR